MTPVQIAELFSDFDGDEQAQFFNECGRLFRGFGADLGGMQVYAMCNSDLLNEDGRWFAEDIASSSRWGSVKMPWPEVRKAFADRILESIE